MKYLLLICLVLLLCASSCKEGYRNRDETIVEKKLKIFFVSGMSKVITVKVPAYTTFAIYQSHGGYRLSYWKYCFGGITTCEEIVKNGVVDFEVLK